MLKLVDDMKPVETNGWVPGFVEELEPGPMLAAVLSEIDVDTVSGYDRVVLLRAHDRLASHYAAQVYRDMAAISDVMYGSDDNGIDNGVDRAAEAASAEVRAALHLTRRAADHEMTFALDCRRRLPVLWDLLRSGRIDVRRARTITDATCHLSVASAQDVLERIVDTAPEMTTGELRARIRKLCIEADPDDAAERYKRSVKDRRVVMEPDVDGTAHLSGYDLPPDRTSEARKYINRIAKSLRGGRETRTMDQIRADVFLDLLTAATNGCPKTQRARNLPGVCLPGMPDSSERLRSRSHEVLWRRRADR